MYRRRRKIRYYNGPSSQEKITGKPWFPFAIVALAALILALVVGAILGGIADGEDQKNYVQKNLYDFGGTEETVEKFAALSKLNGDFLSLSGKENGDIRSALSDLEFGNAVVSVLYDGQGSVYYKTGISSEVLALERKSSVTLDGFAERVDGKSKRSIGVFVSTAFENEDETARIMKTAEETVILSEIAASDVDMILIVGLPCNTDLLPEINSYLKRVYELVPGRMSLAVAVDGTGTSTDMARLVSAAEAYADRLVLDLRGFTGEMLSSEVEQNAYYLTAYRMCVLFDHREDAELLDSYGTVGKLLLEKTS